MERLPNKFIEIKHKVNVLFMSKITGYSIEAVETAIKSATRLAHEIHARGETRGKHVLTEEGLKPVKPNK